MLRLCQYYCMDAPHGHKTHGEKARLELHKNAMCCFEQILEAVPHKTAALRALISCLKKN